MNLKTTLVLAAILGALVLLYFLKTPDAPGGSRDSAKMAPGYDAVKIAKIRIDNVERNEKIVLTRAGDEWRMEDPLRVPADSVGARFLASYLADYEGTPAAAEGSVKAGQIGLDKPRAIVEFESEPPDSRPENASKTQKWVVKIGADDLKGDKVFLDVGGRVYKAPRTLYNSVAKPPSDFRDRRIFNLGAVDVDSITIVRGDETVRLRLEDGAWRLAEPLRGQCDAAAASKIVGLTGLRIETFENDLPGDLKAAGLEPPRATITLAGKGKSEELRLGATNAERTLVQRAGQQSLWSVNPESIEPFVKSADELRDGVVVGTFSNENVNELRWQLGASVVEWTRDPVTRTVKLTKPREAAADRDAFEAALKALQGLKADAIVSAVGANLTDFGLSPAAGSLEMKLKDAPKSIQLDIGATRPEGTFLRRPGDDYLLRVPAAALAAYGRPATEFVSRELVTASTYDAGHVEVDLVEGGALTKRLTFDKNEANRWTRPKETDEVKGFADLLDACLHAKGTEVLAAEPASTALAAPGIEVRIYRRLYNDPKGDDKEKDRIATVRFARTPDGAWLGSGITGSALTGGIAMKVAEDLPGKLTGLAFGAESKPASAPESAPASVPASKPK